MSNVYRPMILAEYNGKKYEFPEELSERWKFLTTKLIYAEQNNFEELFGGYTVVFNCEFKEYQVVVSR